jgi:hypothetical protein
LHSTLANYIVIFAIALVAFVGLPGARASASNPSPGQCVHTIPPSASAKPAKGKAAFGHLEKVRIEFIAPERNAIQLNCSGIVHELSVQDEGWKARLAEFSSGDIVTLSYIPTNSRNELRGIKTFAVEVPFQKRLETFATTGALFFVLAALALWITKGNILAIRELFVGSDKRLSNSKSQAAVWFFALITSYLCLTLLRIQTGGFDFIGGVTIPQNLLLLSGFSALTYAGAKAITQDQVNKSPESKIPAADGQAGLGDYLTDDDGNTDFGDFQMTVITLLAVGIFLMQIFNFTGIIHLSKTIEMPNLDTTILSLFGISQGAYLSKKAAAASGAKEAEPIVFNTKNSKVKDINKQLNKKLELSGASRLNEDGEIYNEFTAEKVLAFQAQVGLPQTGMVDAKTLIKLME